MKPTTTAVAVAVVAASLGAAATYAAIGTPNIGVELIAPDSIVVGDTTDIKLVATDTGRIQLQLSMEGGRYALITPLQSYVKKPDDPGRPHKPFPLSSVALPAKQVNIDWPKLSGKTVVAADSKALQSAINSASAGDVIELIPKATYTNISVGTRSDSAWVVIRTQGFDGLPGHRVALDDSTKMARIVSTGGNVPAIQTIGAARGWRFVGINFGSVQGATVGAIAAVNGHSQNEQPNHIIFDRVIVRAWPTQDIRRCILANGEYIAVIDSWLDECHANGADAQAILAWTGKGPYLFQNNYLAGSGENIMIGGSDSRSEDHLPQDIVIRDNWFNKPLEWKGVWTAKNLLELKVGQRVLIEDNLFTNSWPGAQTGYAWVFKSTNQNNRAPWSQTSDVTATGNKIENVERGINLAGRPEAYPAVSANRMHFENNFVGARLTPVMIGGVKDVTFKSNTFTGISHMIQIASSGNNNLTAIGNVWPKTEYGVHSSNGSGDLGLKNNAPGFFFKDNFAYTGIRNNAIPSGTTILKSSENVPDSIGAKH